MKIYPAYAIAVVNRGWLALVMNQPETAARDAKKALALQADLKPALLLLAKSYLANGQLQDAKLSAQELARRWPNEQCIMELAGDTSVASGELKPARQFYLKNLILAPRDASA